MTPEEAFEAWWKSLGPQGRSVLDEPTARIAWLACSAHYGREIEAVAKELERKCMNEEVEAGKTATYYAYLSVVRLLRTCLLTKGGG